MWMATEDCTIAPWGMLAYKGVGQSGFHKICQSGQKVGGSQVSSVQSVGKGWVKETAPSVAEDWEGTVVFNKLEVTGPQKRALGLQWKPTVL